MDLCQEKPQGGMGLIYLTKKIAGQRGARSSSGMRGPHSGVWNANGVYAACLTLAYRCLRSAWLKSDRSAKLQKEAESTCLPCFVALGFCRRWHYLA